MSQKSKDPFFAGQMVGMLTMLTFLEQNPNPPSEVLDQLKRKTANNAQEYLEKPAEDIFLMVETTVKEIEI